MFVMYEGILDLGLYCFKGRCNNSEILFILLLIGYENFVVLMVF